MLPPARPRLGRRPACGKIVVIPVGDAIIPAHFAVKTIDNAALVTVGGTRCCRTKTCWSLAAGFDKKSWTYVSTIDRLSPSELTSIVAEAAATDQLPASCPPRRTMSLGPRRRHAATSEGELPDSVEVVLGNQVRYRPKLPTILVNPIARPADFQNPEFYAGHAPAASTSRALSPVPSYSRKMSRFREGASAIC